MVALTQPFARWANELVCTAYLRRQQAVECRYLPSHEARLTSLISSFQAPQIWPGRQQEIERQCTVCSGICKPTGSYIFFFVKISSEGHIGCLCVAYVLLRSQHSLSPSDWRPPAKKKTSAETRRSTTRLRLRDSSEEDTEEDRYAEVSSRYVRACSPWPRLRGTLSALSRRELHMRLSRESSQSTPFPRFFSHLVDSLSLVCWQRARPRDLFLRPSCASVPFVGRFHCFRLCDTAAFQQKTGALCYVFSSEGGGCLRSSLPRRDNSGTGSARVAACTVAVLFIFSQTWQQCRGTGRTRANPSQRQHLTLSLF